MDCAKQERWLPEALYVIQGDHLYGTVPEKLLLDTTPSLLFKDKEFYLDPGLSKSHIKHLTALVGLASGKCVKKPTASTTHILPDDALVVDGMRPMKWLLDSISAGKLLQ
jgi:hypothetical protein